MISESQLWKVSLRSHADFLHEKRSQHLWRASSYLRVEQSVMIGCYIVRKLAESKKIADSRFQMPIVLRSFPATSESIDFLNRHHYFELYDLDKPTLLTKPLSYVVNQIIHSFVFSVVRESRTGGLHGFVFNSDRSKASQVYLIKRDALTEAFAACADSRISRATIAKLENGELTFVGEEAPQTP
jgi:hypothetical protein